MDQWPALPQQDPGMQPREEGADPQQPVSPGPGSLLPSERLEVLDRSFVSSVPPQRPHSTSSLSLNMSFSVMLPQEEHKNSKIGMPCTPFTNKLPGKAAFMLCGCEAGIVEDAPQTISTASKRAGNAPSRTPPHGFKTFPGNLHATRSRKAPGTARPGGAPVFIPPRTDCPRGRRHRGRGEGTVCIHSPCAAGAICPTAALPVLN